MAADGPVGTNDQDRRSHSSGVDIDHILGQAPRDGAVSYTATAPSNRDPDAVPRPAA